MPNRNLVLTHLLYMLLPDRILCRTTPEGSTLTLLRLSPDDSGTYTCLAVNPAGRQTKIYTLFVLGQEESITNSPFWILSSLTSVYFWFASVTVPPSISGETTVPREVQVTQDSVVTLECQALGSPPPQISWLKNGHPLLLSPRTRLLSADSLLRSVLTPAEMLINLRFTFFCCAFLYSAAVFFLVS